MLLFTLAANALADQICESAFRRLAELVIMRRFLADYKASAAIARVEPLGRGRHIAVSAIESDAGSHLDKRSTLGKLRWFFVFHTNQGRTLVVLQNADGTDRDFIAVSGLADSAPVSGS